MSLGSLLTKIVVAIYKEENPDELSKPMIDFALACWVLRGIDKGSADPVYHFSFAQFLLAVSGAIDLFVTTIFCIVSNADNGGAVLAGVIIFNLIYGYFTVPYKFYYSYIAWSCAQDLNGIVYLEKDAEQGVGSGSTIGSTRGSNYVNKVLSPIENALFGSVGKRSSLDTHGEKSGIGVIGALVIPLNERRPSVDDEPSGGASEGSRDSKEQVTLYPEAPSRYSL
jgi:hypothetical protein